MKVKRLLSVLIALVLILAFTVPSLAATTAPVTVTQVFAFIGISNSASTYTLNSDNSGTGKVAPSTTYYSNPLGSTTAPSATVVDAECEWTLTNTSNIATDLTFLMADFAGGSDNSTNGNTGSAGATSYGCYTYISGVALASAVLCKSSGSGVGLSNLGATTNKKWGIKFLTQTNAATGPTAATSVLMCTATVH
jgi:hypothetical protein